MAGEAVDEALTDRALSESMDDDIRTTLREIQSREPEPEAEPVAIAPDKPRAPDGKFVKGEVQRHQPGKVSAAPATPDTPEKPEAAPGPEQAAAEPEEAPKFGAVPIDLNRPPSTWKPAAKATWAALPEHVRQEIYRREADYSNGYKGIKDNADFGQVMRQTIDPYRAMIEAEGGTYERAVADTMKTAALFRTGTQQAKLQALFAIDKQFGAGLNAHFAQAVEAEVAKRTGGQPQAGQPAPQPQIISDPRVDTILQSLQQQENERAALERERQAQASATSNRAVETFMAAKDDKGQPLYPFVDNVLEDMSARVGMLRRQNPALEHAEALKQAYDAAVWANPETRAVLLAAQQTQVAQPAETQRRVEAAKRASAVNVPKRGALPATGPAKDLDETIRETGRALGMF